MADIKQGTFIGTATATQPDSTLRSVEVVVFPDNMRGTAEGHYPWDLPGSSMTTNEPSPTRSRASTAKP